MSFSSRLSRAVAAVAATVSLTAPVAASPSLPPYPGPLGDPVTWTGVSDAYNQIRLVDFATVASWLPAGLELVPLPGYPVGKHPVVIVFQAETNSLANGDPVADYREQAVIVPSVRVVGQQTTRNFMPKLMLNSTAAVAIGRTAWGMAKYPATVNLTGMQWDIPQILSASYQLQGQLEDLFTFAFGSHPDFANDLPLFGTGYIGMTWSGPVCYDVVYDLNNVKAQAVTASVTVSSPFLPGLPTGTLVTNGVVVNDPQDSFRIMGPFTIYPAHTCADAPAEQ
jgi:hypothetical protein